MWRYKAYLSHVIGELTQAAMGTVLKTAGTVKCVGIDTSSLRREKPKSRWCEKNIGGC